MDLTLQNTCTPQKGKYGMIYYAATHYIYTQTHYTPMHSIFRDFKHHYNRIFKKSSVMFATNNSFNTDLFNVPP